MLSTSSSTSHAIKLMLPTESLTLKLKKSVHILKKKRKKEKKKEKKRNEKRVKSAWAMTKIETI